MVVNDAVLWLNMDLNANDSSSTGNNGSAEGGADLTATGKIDEGASLNGSTSYVNVPDSSSLDMGTSDLAISLFIKPLSAMSNDTLVWKRNNASGANVGYTLAFLSSTSIRGELNDGGTRNGFKDYTISALSVGVWYHILINFDRSGNQELFINKVSQGTGSISANTSSISNAIDLTIGALTTGASKANYANMVVDLVGVYNHLLDSTDRDDLYNSGDGFNPYASSGYNNKVNGVVASKVNGVAVANISKVNGI